MTMLAPMSVGGIEIPFNIIALEAQNHPSADVETAFAAAAEALVIRQLLLDEAAKMGAVRLERCDESGATLTDEDAAIEALLERVIRIPTADTATCRRYYDGHRDRFTVHPFEIAEPRIADYLAEASYRRAVAQYIALLASSAGVTGVTLGGADGGLVQ